MKAVRAYEASQRLLNPDDVLALSRFSSSHAFVNNKPHTAKTESIL